MKQAYYVTVQRGARIGWLAGPFDSKEGAEARVGDARIAARKVDLWTDFDAFGVSAVQWRPGLPAGRLNAELGL